MMPPSSSGFKRSVGVSRLRSAATSALCHFPQAEAGGLSTLGACPFNRFGRTCGEYDSPKQAIRSLGFYLGPPDWRARKFSSPRFGDLRLFRQAPRCDFRKYCSGARYPFTDCRREAFCPLVRIERLMGSSLISIVDDDDAVRAATPPGTTSAPAPTR